MTNRDECLLLMSNVEFVFEWAPIRCGGVCSYGYHLNIEASNLKSGAHKSLHRCENASDIKLIVTLVLHDRHMVTCVLNLLPPKSQNSYPGKTLQTRLQIDLTKDL